MKYVVSVKEINYDGIEVEASSAEEAKEIAEQEYYNGNIFWKNSDIDFTAMRKEKDRGEAR